MKASHNEERIGAYIRQFQLDEVIPEALKEHLLLFRLEPDEELCRQGEDPQYIHLLVQGKVKIYTSSFEGNTLLVAFTTPLGLVGEIEGVRGWENLNTVTAVTEVETIGFHKRWLAENGHEAQFLRFLLDMVTQKFYSKSLSLSFNLLHPVEVRLASYLLSVTSDRKDGSEDGVRISTLKDTASLIGTSYRHMNRVLQSFIADELVVREKGLLIVTDRQGLTRVAGRNIYESQNRRERL
ncbi:Crp/Fnr family transcriptional regulator [Paenibacillus paeoniae]|uniref:Crp/Fnr family transcriptional regulator n=1 Tax=Paenibacillus paeoniae TaxID=2292705 RepID=A0A371PM73_9BACL|nr:cyclic nucleotide-binding domain-containing protein [Paenibacillus paeoniae]REK76749.1 Crp/Fnr family transcriptional regulator [Paenibacillus paeoniae]